MAVTLTKIFREDWEVLPRLLTLRLDKGRLLTVRTTAVGAAAEATPYHPANAGGTLAYQHGTFALRNEHVGLDGWEQDRPNGVEAIKNEAIRVRLVFANVDVACSDEHEPRARSGKGAGAERLCAGNGLFDDLPRFVADKSSDDGWITFYLMVAPDGAVEMSRATVEYGQFKYFAERLYLSDGKDLDTVPSVISDDDASVDEFDPKVERK